MTNPLRKEHEDITTADIANKNRPEVSPDEVEGRGPKPVQSERMPGYAPETPHAVAATQGEAPATALFPSNELQDLKTNWDRIQTASSTSLVKPWKRPMASSPQP